MINFDFESKCYSCGACANVCRKDAITFDDRLLPNVDNAKCVNCKKCEQVCVNLKSKQFSRIIAENAHGYLCANANIEERIVSSSGGVFILLAKEVLEKGGYVCGCIYDEKFMPKHILSCNALDVQRMMGSKYVKSDLGLCIREINEVLGANRPVLFSGVPCQTAAVRNCLGDQKNLIIVTIVCHGSIEREFWNSYLKVEEQHGAIENITMRDKRRGWDNYGLRIKYKDGSERVTYRKQDGYFLRCFTNGYFQRERCLDCKYKGSEIVGDILLGDAWGLDKDLYEIDDSYGVSCVITLSEKGEILLRSTRSTLIMKSVDANLIISNNKRIVSPAPDVALRKQFQEKCRKRPGDINDICEEYALPSFGKRIINKLFTKQSV
jgi:coenzyme F420-reducing hydrogenase beta subunit